MNQIDYQFVDTNIRGTALTIIKLPFLTQLSGALQDHLERYHRPQGGPVAFWNGAEMEAHPSILRLFNRFHPEHYAHEWKAATLTW